MRCWGLAALDPSYPPPTKLIALWYYEYTNFLSAELEAFYLIG